MNARATLNAALSRFDALSLRERALLSLALLVVLLVAWDSLVMRPLDVRERAARAEFATIGQGGENQELVASLETATVKLSQLAEREIALRTRLTELDSKLAAAGAGLIDPRRMVDVIRAVLDRQTGLTLISLSNQPVRLLAPVAEGQQSKGPFIHPVELVVEGDYFNILSYLRELEALPWGLHWQALELDAGRYPLNRVRIELSTLGMERAWLGV